MYDENIRINEDFDLIIRGIKQNLKIISLGSHDVLVHHEKNSHTRNNYFNKNYYNEIKFLVKAKKKKLFFS